MSKVSSLIALSIVAVIGAMFLNMPEFWSGSPATFKNLIVTLAYIAIWVIISRSSIKSNDRLILRYCSAFWMITLFLGVLMVYVNAAGASTDWAIPLVLLLVGQWYGIHFFAASSLIAFVVMTLITLVMVAVSLISLKRMRSV